MGGVGSMNTVAAVGLVFVTAVVGAVWGPLIAAAVPGAVLLALLVALVSRGTIEPPRVTSLGEMGSPSSWGPLALPASTALPSADDESKPWAEGLGRWIIGIVVVRLVMVMLLNATFIWRYFAPDAAGYALHGELVADWWVGASLVKPGVVGTGGFVPFYYALNAVVYLLTGAVRYPLSVVNTMAGILAALLYGHIAYRIYGRRAARLTFFLVALFPSLMVWTSMNIREVWALLAIGVLLNAALTVRQAFSPASLMTLALSILWVYSIRQYLVVICLVAVICSMVVVRVRQLPFAAVGLVVTGFLIRTYGDSAGFSPELLSTESLEKIDTMRRGLAYGGSAYGGDVDTTTIGGALTYLPEGILRFLCSPFPWNVRSARQLMTVPESLIWYYLLIRAGREIFVSAAKNFTRIALLTFFVLAMVSAYGLVSGNEGTAYRHRAQVMTVLFIFAAGDIARRRA